MNDQHVSKFILFFTAARRYRKEKTLSIELSQILTIVSVCAAVYFAAKSDGRADKDDASKKAQTEAVLSQKLDSISEDTREIRKEITDVNTKVSNLSERVVIVEQSAKSAHHRIDRYEDDEPRRFRRRK